jgi:hypothetical protein
MLSLPVHRAGREVMSYVFDPKLDWIKATAPHAIAPAAAHCRS